MDFEDPQLWIAAGDASVVLYWDEGAMALRAVGTAGQIKRFRVAMRNLTLERWQRYQPTRPDPDYAAAVIARLDPAIQPLAPWLTWFTAEQVVRASVRHEPTVPASVPLLLENIQGQGWAEWPLIRSFKWRLHDGAHRKAALSLGLLRGTLDREMLVPTLCLDGREQAFADFVARCKAPQPQLDYLNWVLRNLRLRQKNPEGFRTIEPSAILHGQEYSADGVYIGLPKKKLILGGVPSGNPGP